MITRNLLTLLLIVSSSSGLFSQAPKVSGFTPASGAIGSALIITGSGFSTNAADNIVLLGPVRASVTSATTTQLNITVPAGASYQPLSVTVNGRIGYAPKPFAVTFPGAQPLSQNAFKPWISFPYSPGPYFIGDVDTDGKSDAVFSVSYNSNVAVTKNSAAQGAFNYNSLAQPVTIAATGSLANLLGADFDGDGAVDFAQLQTSTTLGVYRNPNTSGIISPFATPVILTTVLSIEDFTYADFDGDGLIDIIAISTDYSDFYLSVFQNNTTSGTLSFEPGVDIPLANGIISIWAGDLDGDSMPDLLTSNYDRTLGIFKNEMTGPGVITAASFGTPFELYSNDYIQSLIVADADLDGKNDIILSSQSFVIYHNVGTAGTLSSSSFDASIQFGDGGDLAFGDLNGDGKPELVFATYNAVNVMINNATPGTITSTSFSNPETFFSNYSTRSSGFSQPRLYDLDNDGKSEIIVSDPANSSLTIFQNSFGPQPASPFITSLSPATGAAGSTVVITGTNFGTAASDNIVFFGATRATVNSATSSSLTVTVPLGASLDFVSVTTRNRTAFSAFQFSPYQAASSGDSIAFLVPLQLSLEGDNPDFVSIKDMDNDGLADLLLRTPERYNAYVNVFKNSGQDKIAAFDNSYQINIGYNFGVVDTDGDGLPDIIAAGTDYEDGALFQVAPNTGTIADFGSRILSTEGGIDDPGNFAVADLDGNGLPDVGLAEANSYGNVYFLGNVNGGFPYETSQFLQLDPSATFLAFADIDGDGKPDAVISQSGGNTISVLQNISVKDTIKFSDAVTFATDTTPGMIVVCDLDGDGRTDLVSVNAGSVSILQNATQKKGLISAASFASHFELAVSSPVWAGVADLNGDGKPDLGIANGDSTILIFRNTSSSGGLSAKSFADGVPVSAKGKITSLAFGDLNNDGAQDMAVTIGDDKLVSVYINSAVPAAVDGTLQVYNGVSPNGDGQNDNWHISNIEVLPDTKANHVAIYNRWGDVVYEVDNYDNSAIVFNGRTTGGNELPNGIYFYKITFKSDHKPENGYISLKK